MADKDKNGPVSGGKDDVDWDFDSFGDDEAFGDKPAKATDAGDDEFSDGALGGDDPFSSGFDSFGFGDDEEEDPNPSAAPASGQDPEDDVFPVPAASDDDPFGGGDDAFGLEEMPTPDSMAARSAEGNPDDEFGDLGGEDFAASDGFGDDDGLFGEDGDAASSDDPFAEETSDPFAEDAEEQPYGEPDGDAGDADDDPFEAGNGHEADEQAPAPAERKSRGLQGMIMPLALAASVAFAGYVGYSVLLPILFPPSSPPPPSVAEVAQEPSFPSALPGQPGGLPLPSTQPEDPGQTAMLPEVPQQQAEEEHLLPPADVLPQDPAVFGAPAEPVFEVTVPDALGPEGSGLSLPPAETDVAPSLPSLDEIVGGEGRGGIHALRDEEERKEAESVQAVDEKVAALEERISGIERRVEDIARRVEAIASASPQASAEFPDAGSPPAAVAAPAKADLSVSLPPLKPAIVESATLKGVSRGLAWVSTPSGVVEVREGDTIPGAGKVLRIREYEGRWIVSTPEGLVLQ